MQDQWGNVSDAERDHAAHMARLFVPIVWAFAAWYFLAAILTVLGGSDFLAPFVGLGVGAFVAIDPKRSLRSSARRVATSASMEAKVSS
jgi:hypothetical protein